ncbi:MAG: glucuronate isomerase [Oscillospiraceae bacterium]|nr:glucuronate isomerase [Oscillospiraceae bacterium]
MKQFLDKDFLLSTETAKTLYHEYAAKMPIIDYHCHVSPKEIFEDKHFDNISQVWLSGDHYKWRIMRSNGVDEYYITGGASDREKFQKFAEALPKTIGNPMYHWCHLELKNYFGYEGILNGETAEEVWKLTEEKLHSKDMGVRGLIEKSSVAFIGTTDDPIDSLEWHEKIAADNSFKTIVAPSFRPDKALNIDKAGWKEYIEQLSAVSGTEITGISTLKDALRSRMEYFSERGCKASDHGLDHMIFALADDNRLDEIIVKGLSGKAVSAEETAMLKTALLIFCAKEYVRLGWVMQIHYNCLRNPNTTMLKKIGPDTGFDCIGPENGSMALASLLDVLNSENSLPRTILYSLDAGDNAFLDTLIGSFQGTDIPGKLQHGSAWWFNDNKQGMRDQLTSLANLSMLGNFIGMLTDSRSFLSYTRHEYFRRILCGLVGEWVENGEYPDDMATLGKIIEDISYNNAARYFRLEEKQ